MSIYKGFTIFLLTSFISISTILPITTIEGQQNTAQSVFEGLVNNIGSFFKQGGEGYLLWQFSGNRADSYAKDQYSFYRDAPEGLGMCDAFKKLRKDYPLNILGVNMWDAGRQNYQKTIDHFLWLSDCGVNAVRIFAGTYWGVSNIEEAKQSVKNVLNAAKVVNTSKSLTAERRLRIIVVIGDYANGGGGIPKGAGREFYLGDHAEQEEFTKAILEQTIGSNELMMYEIANEPHCGGDIGAISAYVNWADKFAKLLSESKKDISLGQMANFDVPNCDSIVSTTQAEVSGFMQSNSLEGITRVSAHFYNGSQKAMALAALEKAKLLKKPFYIGEASIQATFDGPIAPNVLTGGSKYVINDLLPAARQSGLTENPDDSKDLDNSDSPASAPQLESIGGIVAPEWLNNWKGWLIMLGLLCLGVTSGIIAFVLVRSKVSRKASLSNGVAIESKSD